MPFVYHDPKTVIHPKKFIKNTNILYDGGEEGFSLAIIDWDGTDHVGIRWNVAIKEQSNMDKKNGKIICTGSPALNGIPSWFILPRELFNPELFDENNTGFMDLITKWHKNQ